LLKFARPAKRRQETVWDFLCVITDGRMMLRQDFAEELKKKLEELEEEEE
jgi:hypothetical protein